MISNIKLIWWWYITIKQQKIHPKMYRENSTRLEKLRRSMIISQLANDGESIFSFTQKELTSAGF
jgi:hypothetical protein